MKMIRSDIRKLEDAINVQEHEVERLEDVKACRNYCLEELLKLVENQVMDAHSL